MGYDATQNWEKDGTTIVKGAMNWLFEDSEIMELIHHEFSYVHAPQEDGEQSEESRLAAASILHANTTHSRQY